MKNFIIRNMPDDLHYKLKLLALQKSTTMNDLINAVLTDYTKNVDTDKRQSKDTDKKREGEK